MAEKSKERPEGPPSGAFGSSGKSQEVPRRVDASVPLQPPLASGPRISFPPSSEFPQGAEELVFENDPHEEPTARQPIPPTLSRSEGHDAWTLDRLSRQSTVPPLRRDEFEHMRELSALPLGEPPTGVARGGALDLVDRSRPLLPPDLISEMEELYALDDLTGALRHAELILGSTPENEQAQRCAQNCRMAVERARSCLGLSGTRRKRKAGRPSPGAAATKHTS